MTVIVTQLSAGSRLFYGLDLAMLLLSCFLGQNSENWVECCEEILFGFHRSCCWCLARDVAAAAGWWGLLFWVRNPVRFLSPFSSSSSSLILLSTCLLFCFLILFFAHLFLSSSSRSLLYNSFIVINHHSNSNRATSQNVWSTQSFHFFSVSLVHA